VKNGSGVARAADPAVVTAEMVAGHVSLDISCLDRLYLNGYVNKLQTPGGVVYFHEHRGKPIVSPALFEPIGEKFRRDMKGWAQASGIPVITFKAGERKAEVMAPTCRPLPRRGARRWWLSAAPRSSRGCGPRASGPPPWPVPAVLLHQGTAQGVGVLRVHLR